jgi:hypothetical protein
MADYTETGDVDRRVRFFDGQFLREQDFVDEQRYHLDRERRLARVAHTPGVVEGLTVTAVPNAPKVTIAPGTAIDGLGRLLVRVDPGDPLDLTELVGHDDDVAVVVGLAYARDEADAPQGGASPRWRENPQVVHFLEGAADAPPADTTLRLARVILQHPDGTAAVDPAWAAARSGVGVRGGLSVSGPATFAGDVSGDGGAALRVSPGLRVTGPPAFDSSTRLDIVNGSHDYGRTNLVLTGRYQDGNDGWTFGTAARNSVVFARTEVASGEGVGAVGDEQVSLQLEGASRSLGILTRDRGGEPAVTVAQDGTVTVGSADLPANLLVGGAADISMDLTVHGGLATGQVGRWSVVEVAAAQMVDITIGPDSPHNVVVVRRRRGIINVARVIIPSGTEGQWVGQFFFHDPDTGVISAPAPLLQGVPLGATAQHSPLPLGGSPVVLQLEVHRVMTVGS